MLLRMRHQLPFCVGYHDPGIVAANQRRGIHVQAWSPYISPISRLYLHVSP